MDKTIKDLKTAKEQASKEILNILTKLENDFSVSVNKVDLNHAYCMGQNRYLLIGASLDVKI